MVRRTHRLTPFNFNCADIKRIPIARIIGITIIRIGIIQQTVTQISNLITVISPIKIITTITIILVTTITVAVITQKRIIIRPTNRRQRCPVNQRIWELKTEAVVLPLIM